MINKTNPQTPNNNDGRRPFVRTPSRFGDNRGPHHAPKAPGTPGSHPPHTSGVRTHTHAPLRKPVPQTTGTGVAVQPLATTAPKKNNNKGRASTYQYTKFSGKTKRTIINRESTIKDDKDAKVPQIEEGVIRIIPLGGVEEVGKNMTAIEIGNDIIVIDAGFQFKTEETPGIDYIITNTKYLEANKSKIRGLLVTHGHMDHIGGIPYIMEKIGNPPIYTRRLTSIMIMRRQEEFPHVKPIDMRIVEKQDRIKLGDVYIRFFAVSHSIPDSMGILIETPWGNVIGTGDLRVDNRKGVPTDEEEESFGAIGKEKNLVLMADSTNASNPGFSLSETVVLENIEAMIRDTQGRLIIGTFASQLQRVMSIIEAAERHGRKVIIEGRSMKLGIEIVIQLDLLKVKKSTFITTEEVVNYPDHKILVLATGSQGEEFAAIMRISNKTHKHIQIKKGDTVLLSSSIIPGNEMGVQKVKDNMSRQGARIIHYKISEIHASGHANADELEWIHRKLKAKFFIPIHGWHYMLSVHKDIALKAGTPEENIIMPDNGSVIEIYDKGTKVRVLKEKASSSLVLVDGFSVGDVQEVVIRDRQMLSKDGMFVLIASIDTHTGKLKKSPDIISRGFVYLKENQELLHQVRAIIKKTIEDSARGMNPIDFEYIRGQLGDAVSKFLFQKTNKRPLVIPVILSV